MPIYADSSDREIFREIGLYLAMVLGFCLTLYFGLLLLGVIAWPGRG